MSDSAPATTGYPPLRSAWFVLAVLLGAYTCSFIDRQLLSVLVQPLKADLNLTDTQISLLQGISFSLFYCTMGLPLGWIADRWHRRNLIIVGITVWTIATLLCGFSRSFWELFFARMLVGFGEAALAPAAYSLIADYFAPQMRGRALTIYSSGIYIGAGLGFVAGGQVASWAESFTDTFSAMGLPSSPWQAAFITVGLAGLLLPPVLLLVREPIRRGKAKAGDAASSNGLAFIATNWRFYLPFISSLSLISIINYTFFSWTPALLQRQHDFTIAQSGWSFGLALIVLGPIGMVMAGYLVDRARRITPLDMALRIPAIANFLALPFACLLALGSTAALALIGICGVVICLSLAVTLGPFAAQITAPNDYRGIVISAYMLTLNIIGLGLGPSIAALIADNLGYTLGQAVAIVACITLPLSTFLYVVAARQARKMHLYI